MWDHSTFGRGATEKALDGLLLRGHVVVQLEMTTSRTMSAGEIRPDRRGESQTGHGAGHVSRWEELRTTGQRSISAFQMCETLEATVTSSGSTALASETAAPAARITGRRSVPAGRRGAPR